MFFFEMNYNQFEYTLTDIILMASSVVLISIAAVCFSFAFQYGSASTVQILENCKYFVQMILGIAYLDLIPNYWEIVGLVCGFSGVLVIVLQKKE